MFSCTGGDTCIGNSAVTFDDNSTATFYKNMATNAGGAVSATGYKIIITGNARVKFIDNVGISMGGTLNINQNINSNITFTENSTTTLENNLASTGGAILSTSNIAITFAGNSIVKFSDNTAITGGALYIQRFSNVQFKENSMVTFKSNDAYSGGALCTNSYSSVTCEGNSKVIFINNQADYSLGGLYILYLSLISQSRKILM